MEHVYRGWIGRTREHEQGQQVQRPCARAKLWSFRGWLTPCHQGVGVLSISVEGSGHLQRGAEVSSPHILTGEDEGSQSLAGFSPLRGGDSLSSARPLYRFSNPGTLKTAWADKSSRVAWDGLAASLGQVRTGSLVSSCLGSFASSRLLFNLLFLSASRNLEPGPTAGLWGSDSDPSHV